jgi:hypothetical protein
LRLDQGAFAIHHPGVRFPAEFLDEFGIDFHESLMVES